jgi:hypothetical protein
MICHDTSRRIFAMLCPSGLLVVLYTSAKLIKNLSLAIAIVLTLFYTRGLGIVVLYVMVSQPHRFSLGFFYIGMAI